MSGLGDPSGTRLVPMTKAQRDIIVRLINGSPSVLWRGSAAYDERMGHLIAMADGWDAAPESAVDTVQDTLCGYMFMADSFPAAEEVLCALRFYDWALGVPANPANEEHQ